MSKVELSYGVLHGPIHHPDTGTYGPTLIVKGDAQNKPVVSMTLEAGLVTVLIPSAKDKKQSKTFLIPLTGFTHTVLK